MDKKELARFCLLKKELKDAQISLRHLQTEKRKRAKPIQESLEKWMQSKNVGCAAYYPESETNPLYLRRDSIKRSRCLKIQDLSDVIHRFSQKLETQAGEMHSKELWGMFYQAVKEHLEHTKEVFRVCRQKSRKLDIYSKDLPQEIQDLVKAHQALLCPTNQTEEEKQLKAKIKEMKANESKAKSTLFSSLSQQQRRIHLNRSNGDTDTFVVTPKQINRSKPLGIRAIPGVLEKPFQTWCGSQRCDSRILSERLQDPDNRKALLVSLIQAVKEHRQQPTTMDIVVESLK